MKRFITILLCVLFLATLGSCQHVTPQLQGEDLYVEDGYLTQEEMTELVTYVYNKGESFEEPDRYSFSSYEMIINEGDEMLVKAGLIFVHNIQDKFWFADDTTTASPFIMLVVVNKPIATEHKDGDGNVIAMQVDVDYEFYGSFYNEEKDAYSVKPNKIFKKKMSYEGFSGAVIGQEITDTREDNPEGFEDEDWKDWIRLFYEKMQVDKEEVNDIQKP